MCSAWNPAGVGRLAEVNVTADSCAYVPSSCRFECPIEGTVAKSFWVSPSVLNVGY